MRQSWTAMQMYLVHVRVLLRREVPKEGLEGTSD
jgi:hypothetical protein